MMSNVTKLSVANSYKESLGDGSDGSIGSSVFPVVLLDLVLDKLLIAKTLPCKGLIDFWTIPREIRKNRSI